MFWLLLKEMQIGPAQSPQSLVGQERFVRRISLLQSLDQFI